MIRAFLVALLLGGVLGCPDTVSPVDGDIQIRVGNESDAAFTNVAVIFPEQEVDYGAVQAGGVSDYRRVTVAYAYARIDVLVGSTELRIQPIDYVGESPLRAGRYTYALDVVNGQLTLELQRDN